MKSKAAGNVRKVRGYLEFLCVSQRESIVVTKKKNKPFGRKVQGM